jgi:hypothetical protein
LFAAIPASFGEIDAHDRDHPETGERVRRELAQSTRVPSRRPTRPRRGGASGEQVFRRSLLDDLAVHLFRACRLRHPALPA